MNEGRSKKRTAKGESATSGDELKRSPRAAESAIEGDETQAYYTVKQIAGRWQCSTKHVRRLIESAELPSHRLGGILRVSADDLYRYERMCREV